MYYFKYLGLLAAFCLLPSITIAADSNISNITASSNDTTPGATSTITVVFNLTTPLTIDDTIIFGVFGEDVPELGLDLSAATADLGSLGSYASVENIMNNGEASPGTFVDAVSLSLTNTVPVGEYTVAISNVINPTTDLSYKVGVTTARTVTASAYTVSNEIVVTTPAEFDTTPLTELKVKNITKTEALLKWMAIESTDFDVTYTVKLFKKNGDVVKTFTGLTEAKKQIAKASNLLKAGKSYKFKVKACDATDAESCTEWSALKSFTMKTAE